MYNTTLAWHSAYTVLSPTHNVHAPWHCTNASTAIPYKIYMHATCTNFACTHICVIHSVWCHWINICMHECTACSACRHDEWITIKDMELQHHCHFHSPERRVLCYLAISNCFTLTTLSILSCFATQELHSKRMLHSM